MQAQPNVQPATAKAEIARLLVSFELNQSKWVLTIQSPHSAKPSHFNVRARDTEHVLALLSSHREQAEGRGGGRGQVVSMDEAGLGGLWLDRGLLAVGEGSHVLHPAV